MSQFQESGIPNAFKVISTDIDFHRNPHLWTDIESAQKPLLLDKIGLYLFTLLIAQLVPSMTFILEYFETSIRGFIVTSHQQIKIFVKFNITFIILKILDLTQKLKEIRKVKILAISSSISTISLIIGGILGYWLILIPKKTFHGFPFGMNAQVKDI